MARTSPPPDDFPVLDRPMSVLRSRNPRASAFLGAPSCRSALGHLRDVRARTPALKVPIRGRREPTLAAPIMRPSGASPAGGDRIGRRECVPPGKATLAYPAGPAHRRGRQAAGQHGWRVLPIVPPDLDCRAPQKEERRERLHRTTSRTVLRSDLRGPRPRDRQGTPHVAPRHRPGRADAARSLSFGAYLTGQWLPGNKLQLAAST